MKICVIGTGAAGWIACNYLKKQAGVDQVTVIGSSSIPTIGVGESATGRFDDFLECIDSTAEEFIRESDAAVKYGVYYTGWSPRDFFHSLKSQRPYQRMGTNYNVYGRLLGKKPKDVWLHDLIDGESWDMIKRNHVSIDAYNLRGRMRHRHDGTAYPVDEYTNTWQFEANKFIAYMRRLAHKDPKVQEIDSRVVDAEYQGDRITAVVLEDGTRISADYFVISTGETDFNERVFRAEYTSLSHILLTDRALFYPLPYKDKANEIHPYTCAQAMKYGWRWITPTYSRIGTGYAFSSRHVSDEDAIKEFVEDIGDPSIEPFVVDFKPRKIDRPFRSNHAFVGMASGFVEPLDAPGLDMAFNSVTQIGEYLTWTPREQQERLESVNQHAQHHHQWWSSFILCQYKTSHRNDTDFWRDQKAVECPWYEEIMSSISDISKVFRSTQMMFYSTIAGKDLQWDIGDDIKDIPLLPVQEVPMATLHHLEFLESMRNNKL